MKLTRYLPGHLLALGAGAAIAAWSADGRKSTANIVDLGGKAAETPHGHRTPANKPPARAALCRATWELLQSKPGSNSAELQARLLSDWFEVDPDAALQAAMDTGDSNLLCAFDAALKARPDFFWNAIHDDRFGSATPRLIDWWANSTMDQESPSGPPSLVLLSHLEELGPVARIDVAKIAKERAGTDAEQNLFLERLATLPDTPENRVMWMVVGAPPMTGCTLFRSPDMPDPDPGPDLATRLKAADTPGKRFMLVEEIWLSLDESSEDALPFAERFNAVPDDVRPEVARHFLATYPEVILATGELISRGEWDLLAARQADPIKTEDTASQLALRDWATTLPERDETASLFQDAIHDYIRQQPADAQAWIETLPSDWKKDKALMLLATLTLAGNSNDPAPADWAIARISDPSLHAKAVKARQQWQELQDSPPGDPFAPAGAVSNHEGVRATTKFHEVTQDEADELFRDFANQGDSPARQKEEKEK